MARLHSNQRYKLTYDTRGTKPRWRKRYKGKDHYFSIKESETKEASYRRCLSRWKDKKAEIDHAEATHNPHEAGWRHCMEWCAKNLEDCRNGKDTPANRRAYRGWLAQYHTYEYLIKERIPFFLSDEEMNRPKSEWPIVLGGGNSLDDGWGEQIGEETAPWDEYEPSPTEYEKTIGGAIDAFLKYKCKEAERGHLSKGRYESLRLCLEHFSNWHDVGKAIAAVSAKTLDQYHNLLLDLVDSGRLSPFSGRDRLAALKQFISWAYERELLDRPRNLDSRSLKISVPAKKIQTIPDDDLTRMLGEASERTRLYLLLMLNTGMQQQDIAQLKPSDVDWDCGRIIRKRGKTKKHASVPTVNYKLWPETFELLKKHKSKRKSHVLVNDNGQPLKTEVIEDGKCRKVDNIRSAFNRLKQKLKTSHALKSLRKTASSKLATSKDYGRFAQYFLGHAPTTVADRHYIEPSQEQFDEAVAWLGEQWELKSQTEN